MCRRLTVAGFSLALLLLALGSAGAVTTELAALRACKRVFAYSGRENAYFFGFEDYALTSERVLPDRLTRTVRVQGGIVTACHDENSAYALYRTSGGFRVMGMRMADGACTDIAVGDGYEVQASSFAAAGGEAFVIAVTGGVSVVAGTDGQHRHIYRFDSNIDRLFVSDDRACARLDNGSVYVVGGGSSFRQDAAPSVTAGFSADGTLTAHTDTQTAVLRRDFVCILPAQEQEQQPAQPAAETVRLDDGYVQATAGTTVAALKKAYTNLTAVYDESGGEVSGALKTGYTALVSGRACLVAVTGDLDGTGTVSSRDVTALMTYFTGGSLTDCGAKAADVNGDGALNNRDLVLLARAGA